MMQFLIDRWPVMLVQVAFGLLAFWLMQRQGQ